MSNRSIISQSLLGHKGRCFDVRYSKDFSRILTASEDGTAKIWNCESKRSLFTFKHDKDSEVLRAAFLDDGQFVISCGADGKAIVWASRENEVMKTNAGSHSATIFGVTSNSNSYSKYLEVPHNTGSQIYACETFQESPSKFLTAADDGLFIWDITGEGQLIRAWSINDDASDTSSNVYGGVRNPSSEIFIFDAKVSPSDCNLIALAISDGTLRTIDCRVEANECARSVQLVSGDKTSHATSVAWSYDGCSMLAALGSGEAVIFDYRMMKVRAVLVAHSKPCFGAAFSRNNSKCITWSSDMSVMVWDLSTDQPKIADIAAESQNDATEHVSAIRDSSSDYVTQETAESVHIIDNFPMFCCAISDTGAVACAGGSSTTSTSFMGVPVHILNPLV